MIDNVNSQAICGVEVLNRWLKQTALQHQAKGISRTFIAVPADRAVVDQFQALGYGVLA